MKKLLKKGLPILLSVLMATTLMPTMAFGESGGVSGTTDSAGSTGTSIENIEKNIVKTNESIVTLDKETLSLNVEAEGTLTASVFEGYTGTFEWSSSNESIVTVSSSEETPATATVTGVAAGSADITVTFTYEGAGAENQSVSTTATCSIMVVDDTTATKVSEESELRTAIASGGSVKLMNDINLNDSELTIVKDVVLDLGGNTLSANGVARVISINKDDINVTIQNGTITGGNAVTGAGINVSKAGKVIISKCIITRNTASNSGGGIYIENGDVLVVDCGITNNEATNGAGGGIYLGGEVSLSSENLSCTIKDTKVTGNSANSGGGVGMGASYGGATNTYESAFMMKGNSIISGNTAEECGGGVYLVGRPNTFTMKSGEINDNTAPIGGGMYIWNYDRQNVSLEKGKINGNFATEDSGGGIYVENALLDNDSSGSLFVSGDMQIMMNTAEKNGGGLSILGGVTAEVKAGVALYNNTANSIGDDIYMGAGEGSKIGNLIIPVTTAMSGDLVLASDNINIDGWYFDGYNPVVKDSNYTRLRWAEKKVVMDLEATTQAGTIVNKTIVNYEQYNPIEEGISKTIALKAAHNAMSTISGVIFNDTTRDDAYTTADSLVSGTTVKLQQQVISEEGSTSWEDVTGDNYTVTTTSDGAYNFTGLASGTYRVLVTARPSGLNRDCSVTYSDENTNGNRFSAEGSTYVTGPITVEAGATAIANAGFYYRSSGGGGSTGDGGNGGGTTDIPDPEPPLAELNKTDHFAYVIGYPEGDVRPAGNITRAEVATIFFRMLTDESRTEIWSTSNDYSDVKTSNWFNNAVSTLSNDNIILGYEDGTFGGNRNITRAEFAAIASRFDTTAVDPDASFFSDVSGHWAESLINRAAALGYIEGYEDGTFKPDQYITRAEAMTLVNRVLGRDTVTENGLLEDMITWPDNLPGTWYYVAVQEATNSHYYDINDSSNEEWTSMREVRDWEAFEKEWSTANSASNPGEVVQ